MRKTERNRHMIQQQTRRLQRLAKFEAYETERVNLTHLPFDHFTDVAGVPGLSGRALEAPERFAADVSLALFKWREVDGQLHRFGMHHHREQELLTPIVGHIEMEVEGEVHLIGPGDSLIIAADAVHRGRPLQECLFYAAFEPPLARPKMVEVP